MTACYPESQNYMFTHMWSFQDLQGNKPELLRNKGTIYDFLVSDGSFKKFLLIVDRARMTSQLDQIDANFTMMIPPDNFLQQIPEEYFAQMDDGLARQILKASSINRKIDSQLITSSPVSYYYTLNPKMRMYITNIGGVTQINNCAQITQYDVPMTNGLVHITNGLVIPSDAHFMN